MLNMIDEELYFMSSDNNKRTLDLLSKYKLESLYNPEETDAKQMKLKKIK